MYYTEDTILFYNGEFLPAETTRASLFSQSLHYGNAVFEGIRSYNTEAGPKIFKAAAHFHRLLFSSEKLSLDCPFPVHELTDTAYELLKRNNLKDAYIRPLVFAGENMSLAPASKSNVMMAVWPWARYHGDTLSRLVTSSIRKPSPLSSHMEAKVCGQSVNSVLATQEATGKGYDEALLLDMDGHVAQGPGANFFCEKDGILYTPAKGNILPGITRATVIEMCKDLGVDVVEETVTIETARNADSAFLTGTAAEIAGISHLDDREYPLPWEDSLGFLLSKKYKQIVTHSEMDHHDSV